MTSRDCWGLAMGFDFFKKKKGRGNNSPDHSDELQFEDIDTSGEFLPGLSDAPAPNQDPYPEPPPTRPPTRPSTPPSQSVSRPPTYPPVPPPQAPSYLDDDITMVNRPTVVPPVPSAATPAPPGPPAAPGPPAPPGPPVAPSPSPQPGPPAPPSQDIAPPLPPLPNDPNGLAPDEVTQVLNKPVSIVAIVAWLVVIDGPLRGEDFRLPTGTVRLGLNPTCEIHLPGDKFISAQHAEVSFRNGAYWLRDLGSLNGLFVNDSKVSEIALKDGDQVKLGQVRLVYKSLAL